MQCNITIIKSIIPSSSSILSISSPQIRMVIHFLRIQPLIGTVPQTRFDKLLRLFTHLKLLIRRKLYLHCFQNNPLLDYLRLIDSMSKWSFAIQQLIENDPQRPHVHF